MRHGASRRGALIAAPRPYDLARTLESGQAFRWTVGDGAARGIVDGAVAVVRPDGRALRVAWLSAPGSSARLAEHLGAREPLAAVEAALARDRVLRRLLPYTSGVALMRQDPWECLISFVISAFNNIPKIRLTIDRLSATLGAPIAPAGRPRARDAADRAAPAGGGAPGSPPIGWSFPGAERLAEAGDAALRRCVLGYRAPYVRGIARLVADGDLDLAGIPRLSYAEARRALLQLPGVGDKVVECVLLFAFGHHEAFPVDVWVQRAVERWYFGGRTLRPPTIRAWARDRFGPLAGYAQQHLFAGARALAAAQRAAPVRARSTNARSRAMASRTFSVGASHEIRT